MQGVQGNIYDILTKTKPDQKLDQKSEISTKTRNKKSDHKDNSIKLAPLPIFQFNLTNLSRICIFVKNSERAMLISFVLKSLDLLQLALATL